MRHDMCFPTNYHPISHSENIGLLEKLVWGHNDKKLITSQVVVAHIFNPSTQEQSQADLCKFEASLVYKSWFQDRLQSYRETLSQNKNKNKQKSVPSQRTLTLEPKDYCANIFCSSVHKT